MNFVDTPRMREIIAIIEPYYDKRFKFEKAPENIKKFHNELVELAKEQQNKWIREMFEDANN